MNFQEQLAICEAATPGPWRVEHDGAWRDIVDCNDKLIAEMDCYDISKNDAAFMAAAREGYPEALRRLIRLREIVNSGALAGAMMSADEKSEMLLILNEQ